MLLLQAEVAVLMLCCFMRRYVVVCGRSWRLIGGLEGELSRINLGKKAPELQSARVRRAFKLNKRPSKAQQLRNAPEMGENDACMHVEQQTWNRVAMRLIGSRMREAQSVRLASPNPDADLIRIELRIV